MPILPKFPKDFLKTYKKLRDEGWTNGEIARKFRINTRTLYYWIDRTIPNPEMPKVVNELNKKIYKLNEKLDEKELDKTQTIDFSKQLIKGMDIANSIQFSLNKLPKTEKTLAKQFKISENDIHVILSKMVEDGFPIVLNSGLWKCDVNKIIDKKFSHRDLYGKNHIKFILVSDTHLGNRLCDLDSLHKLYRRAKEEGITEAYHSGDVIDGEGMFKGQENELLVMGADRQIEYAAKYYPSYDITTHFILGNHEVKPWWDRGGRDVGVSLAAKRKDMDYLGMYRADVELSPGITLRLIHPDWGSSYSESYHLQRYVDNLPIEDQPSIIAFGHIHSSCYVIRRGIHAILVGTQKHPGDWEKRKGWQTSIGGYICDLEVTNDKIISFGLKRI